jgi:hypothetical protein
VQQREQTIKLQATWGEVKNAEMKVIAIESENTLGDSGTGVFNEWGELIGVVVGVGVEDEHVTYAVQL